MDRVEKPAHRYVHVGFQTPAAMADNAASMLVARGATRMRRCWLSWDRASPPDWIVISPKTCANPAEMPSSVATNSNYRASGSDQSDLGP